MKNLFVSLIAVLFAVVSGNAEIATQSYLKIEFSNNKTISYPPETGFTAQDVDGNTILNPSDLEKLKVYEIVTPITLYVFVYWKDEPDTYSLQSGKLVLGKTDRDYSVKTPQDHFNRPTDGNYKTEAKAEKRLGMTSNGVYLTKERYFSYDEKTGYDTSLTFSNGVVFYFKDGKASAWQDGRTLDIEGKYLIKTITGVLKISYNSATKKLWYVFEKN